MSLNAYKRAWAAPVKGRGEFLVLLAMADFAGHDCMCWASANTIADKVGGSVRSVKRNRSSLVADGRLKCAGSKNLLTAGGPVNMPIYEILEPSQSHKGVPNMTPGVTNGTGCQTGTSRGAKRGTEGGDTDDTQTVEENSKKKTVSPYSPPEGDKFGFDKVFSCFPNQQEKYRAEKTWKRLHKKGALPPLIDMVRLVRMYDFEHGWSAGKSRAPKFYYWLSGHPWLEEIETNDTEEDFLRQDVEWRNWGYKDAGEKYAFNNDLDRWKFDRKHVRDRIKSYDLDGLLEMSFDSLKVQTPNEERNSNPY